MRLRVLGGLVLGTIGATVTGFAAPTCRTCKPSQRTARTWNRPQRMLFTRHHCNTRMKRFVSARETSADDARRSLMRRSRNSSPVRRLSRLHSSTTDEEGVQQGSSTTMQPDAVAALLPLALLNAVTLLWGTQHAVIKLILQEDLSPGVTNFARFGIAALLFSPWTPGVLRDPLSAVDIVAGKRGAPSLLGKGAAVGTDAGGGDRGDTGGGDGCGSSAADTWRAGAELGVWMFLGFAFQAVGLCFTTAR